MSIFESVQELFLLELYEEVIFLSELVPETSRPAISPKNEFILNVYFAESYYNMEKYNLANLHFCKCLDMLPKIKDKNVKTADGVRLYNDAELRFKCYKGLAKLKRFDDAYTVLLKVHENEVTPKIKYAQKSLVSGRDVKNHATHTLPYYEEIVKLAPSALLSHMHILKMGTGDLNSIEVPAQLLNIHHVSQLLKASELLGNKLIRDSIDCLIKNAEPSFRLLTEAGGILYINGYAREAREILAKANNLNKAYTHNMDLYASLLYEQKNVEKTGDYSALEELAMRLIREDPESVEANVAFGYLSATIGWASGARALQIASNACKIMPSGKRPSTHALILRSNLLLKLEKFDELLKFGQDIQTHDPYNFDLQKNHITVLYKKNCLREAKMALQSLWLQSSDNPRVRLFRAQCLLKNNNVQGKTVITTQRERILKELKDAMKLLEKLVTEHPHMTDAFWPLIDLYEKMGKLAEARQLIKGLLNSSYPKDIIGKLHHHMVSLCQRERDPIQAFEHAHIALANGHEGTEAELANLDHTIYQTPSPMAPMARAPAPHAPRRNRQARNDMDSSAEFSGTLDNSNG